MSLCCHDMTVLQFSIYSPFLAVLMSFRLITGSFRAAANSFFNQVPTLLAPVSGLSRQKILQQPVNI
jgi:hypothetical protein